MYLLSYISPYLCNMVDNVWSRGVSQDATISRVYL